MIGRCQSAIKLRWRSKRSKTANARFTSVQEGVAFLRARTYLEGEHQQTYVGGLQGQRQGSVEVFPLRYHGDLLQQLPRSLPFRLLGLRIAWLLRRPRSFAIAQRKGGAFIALEIPPELVDLVHQGTEVGRSCVTDLRQAADQGGIHLRRATSEPQTD
eukprot:scaffold334_cov241-Pinguiococcus_pyrenoidosus.AAC.49